MCRCTPNGRFQHTTPLQPLPQRATNLFALGDAVAILKHFEAFVEVFVDTEVVQSSLSHLVAL